MSEFSQDEDDWGELPRAPREPLMSSDDFRRISENILLNTSWHNRYGHLDSQPSAPLTRHMVYAALGLTKGPNKETPGVENNNQDGITITSRDIMVQLEAFYKNAYEMTPEMLQERYRIPVDCFDDVSDHIAFSRQQIRALDVNALLNTRWLASGDLLHSLGGELTPQIVYSALELEPPANPSDSGMAAIGLDAVRVSGRELAEELEYFYSNALRNYDENTHEWNMPPKEQLHASLENIEKMLGKKSILGWNLCWIAPLMVLALPLDHAQAAGIDAKPSHCFSLYDACKYSADFKHFDYVNPKAPQGGHVKLAENGTFDSLNPFILKGVKAPGIGDVFESLMVPSLDEPQAMYGLVAQTIAVPVDNSYAEFVLRKEARWHDGTPITPEDVVFSFETLKGKGDPTFKILYASVKSCEKTGESSVKFTFTDAKNRELPLIAAQLPLISKAYYSSHDFEKTTLDAPMGSGPYDVDKVDQGRSITYKRVENYWARNLPVMVGQYNFATIRYDMYRDENVALEALKSGDYDFRREYIARNWATAYDAPAIKDGRIIKREIPDQTPQGMQAFIYNTRKPAFSDARVREAIDLSLDYEWVNKTIFYGAYVRNASYFENTDFQAKGAPSAKELELLKPFMCHPERSEGSPATKSDPSPMAQDDKDCLPAALIAQEYKNPRTDGSGNARESLLKAQKLLEEAGWVIKGGKRVNSAGEPLSIEFLLRQPTMERVIGPMRKNLERLGITSSIRIVDDSQYQKRTDESDFDIVSIWINRGVFFPGNEQTALWHSSQADIKGGNNLGGVKSKVVDSLLEALTSAKNKEDLVAAGRALDRVLLWQHYVIPNWHSGVFRVAYWDKFGLPQTLPKYNLGFQTWWIK